MTKQVIAPFSILLGACIVMAFYVYDTRTREKRPLVKTNTEPTTDTFVGNDGDDSPPVIQKRAAQILWVWHDIATSRLLNSGDVNSMYRLWSSQMVKRNVPDVYINSQTFDNMRVLTIANQMTPDQVVHMIKTMYDQEMKEWAHSRTHTKHVPVSHICLN